MEKQNLNKTRVVSKIYETADYNQFSAVDDSLYDQEHINYLIYAYQNKHKPLHLIVVKPEAGYLKIVEEQDSFYAAKRLGVPLYYYEKYKTVSKPLHKVDLSYNDLEDLLKELLDKYNFIC